MSRDLLEIVLYHDVLCGWSMLADARLRLLAEELGPVFTVERRPFGVQLEEGAPGLAERRTRARALRKVAKEPEGGGVIPELWSGIDPPRSSLPPLLAVEAARVAGGPAAEVKMLDTLREAALRRGVNVAREDAIVELAEKAGLDLRKFVPAFRSESTRRFVIAEHEQAAEHGINAVPSIVIHGEWLMSGARPIDEIRAVITRYVSQRGLIVPERVVH